MRRVYCPRACREGCPTPGRIARGIAVLEALGATTEEDIEDIVLLSCGPCADDVTVDGEDVDILPMPGPSAVRSG